MGDPPKDKSSNLTIGRVGPWFPPGHQPGHLYLSEWAARGFNSARSDAHRCETRPPLERHEDPREAQSIGRYDTRHSFCHRLSIIGYKRRWWLFVMAILVQCLSHRTRRCQKFACTAQGQQESPRLAPRRRPSKIKSASAQAAGTGSDQKGQAASKAWRGDTGALRAILGLGCIISIELPTTATRS